MQASLRPLTGEPRDLLGLLRDWVSDDAAGPVVVRTSGSTGSAKSVVLSRRALLASASAATRELGGPGQWLLDLPATYVAGFSVLVRSVLAETEPVLATEHDDLSDAVAAMTGDRRYVSLVPTQLHRLRARGQLDLLASFDAVLVGGAALRPELASAARQAGVHLVETYGLSETCGGCVYDGRPLAGISVRIATDGVVELSGPVLFDGYEGEPPHHGWLRTQDLGEVGADGRLTVLGRIDDVAVSGGVNVPLGAVSVLLQSVPGVEDAVALAVPDEEWGERVVAAVVAKRNTDVAPAFEFRPAAWRPKQLVWLDALPLLPNGKVDRVAVLAAVAGSS